MNNGSHPLLFFTFVIISLQLIFETCAIENKHLRNVRQRGILNKRPIKAPDAFATNIRPVFSNDEAAETEVNYYSEGNWKPLYESPIQQISSKPKKLRASQSQKHLQNVIFTTEYYPKIQQQQAYASTNYITNQSLLVSDFNTPAKTVGQKPKRKQNRLNHLKKNLSQYEVYETINEDANNYYDATQNNKVKYQEAPIIIGKAKNSGFSEPIFRKGKHIHHVHFHNDSPFEKRPGGKPHFRNSRPVYLSKRPFLK